MGGPLLQCMSPLMAQSGHPAVLNQSPLLGVKRTLKTAEQKISARRVIDPTRRPIS
jgi:hypothetical protein